MATNFTQAQFMDVGVLEIHRHRNEGREWLVIQADGDIKARVAIWPKDGGSASLLIASLARSVAALVDTEIDRFTGGAPREAAE